MFTEKEYREILKKWDLRLIKIREDLEVMESPFRTVKKIVFESKNDRVYILEQIAFQRYKRKKEIIETLNLLKRIGVEKIQTYIPSVKSEYIEEYKLRYWQLREYVDGNILKRPEYISDSDKGRLMAEFLSDFYSKTSVLDSSEKETYFSLKEMFYDVKNKMELNSKDIAKELDYIVKYLEDDFFKIYDNIPLKLCHGDFHPLNVIWKDDKILKVIDWEFVSWKPEIYDIANLIGCVGMETPTAFLEGFLKAFMANIKKNTDLSKLSLDYLIDFIICLRYAGWLSLWLRNNDDDMIDLEIKYINLIFENKDKLKKMWMFKENREVYYEQQKLPM